MAKTITFIQLVRAAYESVPKKLAPKLIQKLLKAGILRFEHPSQVKRLVPQH